MNIARTDVKTTKPVDSELVFKHVNLALKCLRLYPANHATTEAAIDKLWRTLNEYFKNHGHLAFRVTREAVFIGTEPPAKISAAVKALALQLYTLKLDQVLIQATIDQRQLLELLTVVSMDPVDVAKAGGVQELLWQKQVTAVNTAQAKLKLNREVGPGEIDANTEIDAAADLAAAQQALLSEVNITELERQLIKIQLEQGTEQLGQFLQTLGDVNDPRRQAAAILRDALPKIDALIKKELGDEQAFLYRNLSEAIFSLQGPLGAELAAKLIDSYERRPASPSAGLIAQLSGEELSGLFDLALGAKSLPKTKFLQFLENAPLRPEQLQDLVPFLQERSMLNDKTAKRLLDAKPPKAKKPIPSEGVDPAKLAELAADLDPAGLEKLTREIGEATEGSIEREALAALADVIALETDPGRFTRAAHAIQRILVGAFEERRLGAAGEALAVIVKEAARRRDENDILAILNKVRRDAGRTERIEVLLSALENESEASVTQATNYLTTLGGAGITSLLDLLAVENRQSRRRLICQLLMASGQTNIASLGNKVMDHRWYLVRNVALVLGQIGDENAVIYLQKAAGHDDPRVRLEVAKALANTGPTAFPIAVGLLIDSDMGVKLEAIRAIAKIKHPDAADELIKLIRQPDLFKRRVDIKIEAIIALGALRAEEAAPYLKTIAGGRSIFFKSQQAKLAAAARSSLAKIHGRPDRA